MKFPFSEILNQRNCLFMSSLSSWTKWPSFSLTKTMIPPCPLPFLVALFHTAIFEYPSNLGVLHPSCSWVSMRQIMSLSPAIGPNRGPCLLGYPLQFQQTKLKETWADLDCYLFCHVRPKFESTPLLAHNDHVVMFSVEASIVISLLPTYYVILE